MEWGRVVLAGLAGVGIMAVVVLGWNIIAMPVKLEREQRQRRREMRARGLLSFEEDDGIRPHLWILSSGRTDRTGHYEEQQGNMVVHRLGVRATGMKTIDDVKVRLIEIQGRSRKHMGVVSLPQASLEPIYRYDDSSVFSVHLGQEPTELLNLLEWHPVDRTIRLCYNHNLYVQHPQIQDSFAAKGTYYAITLAVEGRDIRSTKFTFYAAIKGDILHIEDKDEHDIRFA